MISSDLRPYTAISDMRNMKFSAHTASDTIIANMQTPRYALLLLFLSVWAITAPRIPNMIPNKGTKIPAIMPSIPNIRGSTEGDPLASKTGAVIWSEPQLGQKRVPGGISKPQYVQYGMTEYRRRPIKCLSNLPAINY